MMFFENTEKIFYGSVLHSLDRRMILGSPKEVESIVLLRTLKSSLAYAELQYNSGVTEYLCKVQKLEQLITKLTTQCPKICVYKNRYISPEICVNP